MKQEEVMNQSTSFSPSSSEDLNPCPICLGPILHESYLNICFRTFSLSLFRFPVWLLRKLSQLFFLIFILLLVSCLLYWAIQVKDSWMLVCTESYNFFPKLIYFLAYTHYPEAKVHVFFFFFFWVPKLLFFFNIPTYPEAKIALFFVFVFGGINEETQD